MDQRPMEKLLLMGPGGAGKTCMRSIIFDNYLPRDALRLGITISLDQSQVHILRNLFLNLWDCGGQHRYVAEYLGRQKEYIFRYVGVMLFVFDINSMSGGRDAGVAPSATESNANTDWKLPEMLEYFRAAMGYINEYSPNAKVFVLLHKIDLINKDMREAIFEARKKEILDVIGPNKTEIQFFGTSIWSDSLYLAYSAVVRSLVPHRDVLLRTLRDIAAACDAVEVALYERSTFLCLAHMTRREGRPHGDGTEGPVGDGGTRTTEMSEIVKHFKLSCLNNAVILNGLSIATGDFTALLHPFTEYTHVLVVSDDPDVDVELHRLNVTAARKRFQQFLQSGDSIAVAMNEVL
ncbi:ras-like small GTPase [Strigomonas culicis]|uniref:Ras-like small GTPase n=1 Tax=Strigomonas culicis TaxID=28005 RepID=S9V4X9_9TRYP|nr:ras-like small GTPase [Strigomonas culicis]|eukprot:EPY21976.1 ras-like small GTPase [Strigomonas culicis]